LGVAEGEEGNGGSGERPARTHVVGEITPFDPEVPPRKLYKNGDYTEDD
jgi:hypothetical protein